MPSWAGDRIVPDVHTSRASLRRVRGAFTTREWVRLGGLYGVVVALHLAGWGLFLTYGDRLGPAYAGAGGLAYSFGLRHAFDADHISAIDDTTRFLMQRGKKPLGTGFFFSLGHSTVVVALAVAITFTARSVEQQMPGFEKVGGTLGATISGTFLLVIAILDLMIFRGILDVWRRTKRGEFRADELDALMTQRGFINRLLGPRWRRFITESWQLYPVGFLFGLGFDTASEIGLLALTAAAATGGVHHGAHASDLPVAAILALPLLFTAGMTLMDTTDGVVMAKAYDWAFKKPLRKVYYNLATVGLGVFVAGFVGLVEYLQVLAQHTGWNGAFWRWLNGLNFEVLGYIVVAAFLIVWLGSVALYKWRRLDERYDTAGDGDLAAVSEPGR